MNEFSGLDIVIAVIVLFSLYRGFKLGLVRSLVGLAGWFATLYVGTHYAREMGYLFSGIVKDPVLQTALAFLVIVLLMLTIVWGASLIVKSMIDALALTPIEKLAGGIFGSIRGVVIVLVVMSFIGSWASKTESWQHSILAKALSPYAPLTMVVGRDLASTAWDELNPNQLVRKHPKTNEPATDTEKDVAVKDPAFKD
ncbi:MAG: CvpA family protein [Candidatus Saccharibacteria bacterium]|nr:CvpA family protein [Moraxellaceae bacterium]